MDFQGVDLRSVLRTFAEISGLNMVIDPDVQGTVDIVLTDVPWDQALEVILRGNQLDYTVDGTIVRIARIDTLRARAGRADAARRVGGAGRRAGGRAPTRSATRRPTGGAAASGSRVLSPRGKVQIDARTNTLIITDLPARLETVAQLLGRSIAPSRRSKSKRASSRRRASSRARSACSGASTAASTPSIGNTTEPGVPEQRIARRPRRRLQGRRNRRRANPRDAAGTAVNLGVAGATSAIGLALGAVNGAFNLDVALSALERTGKGRILSTPRVTTQNNVEAEITQGVQIPVQTVANEHRSPSPSRTPR